jgi:hypothetical protein
MCPFIEQSRFRRHCVDNAFGYETVYQGFFPTAGERVVSYQFFDNQPAISNWLTPLILAFQGGRIWQITGVGKSVQNTGAGLQTHVFDCNPGLI